MGLGNPGREYNNTRHNIGFMCIDKLCEYFKVNIDSNKFNGSYTQFNHNGEKIILLKPGKYMNLSGEVIRDFVNFFKILYEGVIKLINADKSGFELLINLHSPFPSLKLTIL